MSRLYNVLEAITEKFLPRDNIRTGLVTGLSVPANSYLDVPVTFSNAMQEVPEVVAGLYSTSAAANIGLLSVVVMNVSKTGFTARIYNADTSSGRAPGLRWIACVVGGVLRKISIRKAFSHLQRLEVAA